MAVSKMQKWVILVDKSVQTDLLETVQELQHFEPISWYQQNDEVAENNAEELRESIQLKESEMKDILLAESILQPYVDKKVTKQRFSLSMRELQQKIGEVQQRSILPRVLELQTELLRLEKRADQLIQRQVLLKRWEKLPVLPEHYKTLSAVSYFVGTLPQLKTDEVWQTLKQDARCYSEKLFEDEHEFGLIVYCHPQDRQQVLHQLNQLHFSDFDYPFKKLPVDEMVVTNQKLADCTQRLNQIKDELANLAHNYTDLMLLEEDTFNCIERYKAQLMSQHIGSFTVLAGWLSCEKEMQLRTTLKQQLPQSSYALIKEDLPSDESEIPIELTNHPLVEPFELLTEMYSLPKYSEIDPTPYLAPFYAVFFGMMIADVGYGLLMLIGTWYALNRMSFSSGMRKNLRLFHILSYPTILWGLLFGSFFSLNLPFQLLSTTTDATSILIISVVFGVIQLLFGLAINTQQHLKFRRYSSAFSDGLGWIGLLVGVIMLVLSNVLALNWLASLAQYVLLANVVVIILATMFGSKNKLLGFGAGLYKLYGVSGYIGDLASYTRLMALCVAGASIGSSFNLIVNMLPAVARFTIGIILFIILHALNIGISILGAYVHAIRLQFVEFFGKFYEGGGRKLKPLKTYEKYIDLKDNVMEEN